MKSTWLLCFYAFIRGGGAALSFTTVTFYVRDLQLETELTTCFVQPISDNEENKHDEVTFQLAADFDSVHLWSDIIVTDIVF